MAYHQVPVKPVDVVKTSFITHVELYKMIKMSVGLCNASATFWRLMFGVVQGFIGHICLAYTDDVIFFSKKQSNHIDDLRSVLERIRSAKLMLKPAKIFLVRDQVLYLGHLISAAGVAPDFVKLQDFANWPKPTTV